MLPTTLRVLRSRSAAATARPFARYVSTATTSNQVPANDPVKRDAKPNVSSTNAVPTSSEGSFDKVLQESPEAAEKMRVMQAPNYKGIWSRSQNPREVAMSGPRFEQSIMEDQVRWKCSGWRLRRRSKQHKGRM
jgi:NADH dehydrogenase (ubiquinone) Fe-S protein 6